MAKKSGKKKVYRTFPKKKRTYNYGKPRVSRPPNKCGLHYALALADPFDPKAQGVCVPRLPGRSSVKQFGKTTGTFVTNQGKGFIGMCPSQCSAYRSIVHNNNNWTGTTFDGTDVTRAAGFTTYVTVSGHTIAQLQTADDSVMPARRSRIVCAGLRVRYIGREENMNGIVYAISSPSHSTLEFRAPSNFATLEYCKRVPVTKDWVTITMSPVDDSELDYAINRPHGNATSNEQMSVYYPYSQGFVSSQGANDDLHGAINAGIFIECEAPTANNSAAECKFEYEYIYHYEWYDVNEIQSLETRNQVFAETDEIVSLSNQARGTPSQVPGENNVVSDFVNSMKTSASNEVKKIGRTLGSHLGTSAVNWFSNKLMGSQQPQYATIDF